MNFREYKNLLVFIYYNWLIIVLRRIRSGFFKVETLV